MDMEKKKEANLNEKQDKNKRWLSKNVYSKYFGTQVNAFIFNLPIFMFLRVATR